MPEGRRRPQCPFAAELDRSPWRAALKDRLLHAAIPPARACVRYAPSLRAREYVWTYFVAPYLAYHVHQFNARTRFGPRIAGTTLDILQQQLYYFGIWEPILTRWIQDRLGPGEAFVDVGANVGYFSMLASVIVGPTGSVVSIEASPTICSQLAREVARNRLDNVRVVNAAAAAETGRQMVFMGPQTHTGLSAVRREPHLTPEREVRAAPLPNLLSAEELHRARLIKIDVEGAEDAVIAGLAPRLAETSRELEIVVEMHPGDHSGLIKTLGQAGFHPYQLEIDYSPLRYDRLREPPRPRRLRSAVDGECDVVFSRRDGESL
jgi:FkbM family methyltransferase